MTAPEPTQPLTDDQLAQIRGHQHDLTRRGRLALTAYEMGQLLAEVDRLRADLGESEARRKDLFRRLGEHMDDLGDANTELSRLRAENTAQAAALTEVKRLHQPYPDGGGIGFRDKPYPDGDGAYGSIDPCCQVCGTPGEYAAPYPCGTARALGLDQSGEGQANG
ncbi:hypothetical protein [Glycomyces paridis]|uniref:Uncharacterized protein n=1 Tax=Glycomyces paridis TaxID=2126555 RepID=A0A4S8P6U1_9ACTN|nr:hypothetical protein [Glycomyces paridis]THV25993.1 hypothetical protein E9998_19865 [Glycomyces paridis]